ncbi:MAG: VRR-NUC domain-containing protein [Clostridiales bacterium]|nr:VRR-NUC domain-containing protein [Clostridiales bacterium]
MTEKQFEDKVVKPFLKKLPKCWFFKVHGGSVFQIVGVPDIVGVINGKFIGLELKTNTGKPSDLQLVRIRDINKAGGYAKIVRPNNWEEIKEELMKL